MTIQFYVGMVLDINDECLGTVKELSGDRIYIDSECFRGWATMAEISQAIEGLPKSEQCRHTRPQLPSSAA
jgi:hypothetical protein